jgi:hypothetical protein
MGRIADINGVIFEERLPANIRTAQYRKIESTGIFKGKKVIKGINSRGLFLLKSRRKDKYYVCVAMSSGVTVVRALFEFKLNAVDYMKRTRMSSKNKVFKGVERKKKTNLEKFREKMK